MRILHVVGLTAGASLFFALSVLAAEKKIKRSDLPPAVEKTVAAQSLGATIRGFSEERENGQTFYEAEMTVNHHNKDILMDAGGVVVEIEEQIAMDSLPTDVQDALRAKAGKGKIVTVESITKREKLLAYEAAILTKGLVGLALPVGIVLGHVARGQIKRTGEGGKQGHDDCQYHYGGGHGPALSQDVFTLADSGCRCLEMRQPIGRKTRLNSDAGQRD